MGKCIWEGGHCNSTGIFKQLYDGTVDFSLMSLAYQDYDDQNLFPRLILGPHMTVEQDRSFMSTAEVVNAQLMSRHTKFLHSFLSQSSYSMSLC